MSCSIHNRHTPTYERHTVISPSTQNFMSQILLANPPDTDNLSRNSSVTMLDAKQQHRIRQQYLSQLSHVPNRCFILAGENQKTFPPPHTYH
jgi:hypothetical protein